jgi:hypothetical protein
LSIEQPDIAGFATKISRYFLDFLETDFKKQRIPRRRIQLKNEAGFRTGMPLRKYDALFQRLWKEIDIPVGDLKPLSIPRKRYTATISSVIKDLIRQHIESIELSAFIKVREETLLFIQENKTISAGNPESFIESVQNSFSVSVSKHIITPILVLLDCSFRSQSYSAIDSIFEVETDLLDTIVLHVNEQLPSALNTFIIQSKIEPAEKVFDEFFSMDDAKQRVKSFFEDFATSDAYQEIRDLTNYIRVGGENLQLYLYICDFRYGTTSFPVFYIPVRVSLDDQNESFLLELEPHLYLNKRAVDYIFQELSSSAVNLALSPIENRIIYLDPKTAFIDEISLTLNKIIRTFDLAGEFDVRVPIAQSIVSSKIKFSKSAYFAVSDKSDESLLNDYEALLNVVSEEEKGVVTLFESIIRGFLVDEPISVRESISDNWEGTTITDRLVAVSPIPLNEEQRKIIAAINNKDCRFITVQGPPGTGKSHTITAIAFDCILNEKSVLILSDKQEALDVVEDKLKNALAFVRNNDDKGGDFPDPILRLGKIGNSYTRLISQSSQEQIRAHYRSSKACIEKIKYETTGTIKDIHHAITNTIDAYSQVHMNEIEELHELEDRINLRLPDAVQHLQTSLEAKEINDLEIALNSVCNDTVPMDFFSLRFRRGSYAMLYSLVQVYAVATRLAGLQSKKNALCLFEPIGRVQEPLLRNLIFEYEKLRKPLIGYLFNKSKASALDERLGRELPCTNTLNIHNRLDDLKSVHKAVSDIRQELDNGHYTPELDLDIYRVLLNDNELCPTANAIMTLMDTFRNAMGKNNEIFDELVVGGRFIKTAGELIDFLTIATRYTVLWSRVSKAFESVPSFDYYGSKSKLEKLYTTQMTHEIDRRFIEFVDKNRATAKTLGGVIKAKQQFPRDTFETLKKTFPCIIAAIREFAEFVPLQQKIFDLVVIDEASQVSVAQAFPALLRAKKVVVFGDQKQFSNVKSANASIALNQGYLTDLESYFRTNISTASDKIQRLKQFDVKNSVLEFFDLIANYTDMLRKHFRGYQELISFSSKYFYNGQLQAIKVRGKSIEDIIEFSFVQPSIQPERYKNVNTPEFAFILQRLREMIDNNLSLTVGIITPFREQQEYLTRMIFADSYANQFDDILKLKIMTFDTCQGEERDVIIYSMVATPNHDGLNYIFPVNLDNAAERIEEALKAKRLNVGLSRAKEKIHFVLSKPINEYKGSIQRVLSHYDEILNERFVPQSGDTDPHSPMEAKILDYLTKTQFYQLHEQQLELVAQFSVGAYLKQLDPTYQHPAYRCDFLLRYKDPGNTTSIIIEYDGFKEHFTEYNRVHAGNYEAYYKPEDIERQMILESYGFRFLRINRFNLGRDPVAMLSERLYNLIDSASKNSTPRVLTNIHNRVNGLQDGTAKHCKKCGQIKPLKYFYDQKLAGGQGGNGHICSDCKANS